MTSNILRLNGVEFVFKFSFSPDDHLLPPPYVLSPPVLPVPVAEQPYLECLIYRNGYPGDYFHWAGILGDGVTVPFELLVDLIPTSPPIPDNTWLQGNFWLYTNSYTLDSYVWFDFNYGPDGAGEYEGAMVQIPDDDKNA